MWFSKLLPNFDKRIRKLSQCSWSNVLHLGFSTFLNFDHVLDSVVFVTTACIFVICRTNRIYMRAMNENLNRTMFDLVDEVKVSVLIAARDEENNIERCVRSLMHQSYSNYEILVMDDKSTDSTGQILERLKLEFDETRPNKFQHFFNEHLPSNWYGKSYSIHCLAKKANGEILLITDADTVHSQDSVRFCVHSLIKNNVDFLSGSPKQNLNSFGLKVILPSMFIMSSCIIPLWLIDRTKNHNISLAIGQLMVVYKKVFDSVGGFEKVGNKICEDLQFARLLKLQGYKTKFVALEDHIECTMYSSFTDAFFGMSKNVFDAIDHSFVYYGYATLIFGSIIYPFIFFAISKRSPERTVINSASIALFALSWSNAMRQHRLPVHTVVYYPLMMVSIFSVSLYSHFVTFFTKGFTWKGRIVN